MGGEDSTDGYDYCGNDSACPLNDRHEEFATGNGRTGWCGIGACITTAPFEKPLTTFQPDTETKPVVDGTYLRANPHLWKVSRVASEKDNCQPNELYFRCGGGEDSTDGYDYCGNDSACPLNDRHEEFATGNGRTGWCGIGACFTPAPFEKPLTTFQPDTETKPV